MQSGAPARPPRSPSSVHTSTSSPRASRIPWKACPRNYPRIWCDRWCKHRPYVSLEPLTGGQYLIRTAAALGDAAAGHDGRFVVAVYPVPAQLAALSEAVQSSYHQYGDLAALREPLKYSFRLTLTLVLLLAMLAAIYGAIFSAQRLVRPVQDLIEGTRAVGKGDFGTRLPLPSRDEMGFLVHSFNDMTKRLRRARAEATHSQQAVERERERLAIILARLSTGVLAIDRSMVVRTANEAAGAILGTDLSGATGRSLPELAGGNERLGQFVAALAVRFAAGARGVARAARSGRRRRTPHAHVRLHPAPGRGFRHGLRDRVRRHHHAPAGAARCRLGRGRAAPGARDQESPHPHPAVGRAPAPAPAQRHERARRRDSRARHAHHRCSRCRPCSRW